MKRIHAGGVGALVWFAAAAAIVVLSSCGGSESDGNSVRRSVTADGSSTVYPVTEAVAEEFTVMHGRSVRVIVARSGTGGGFRRFCAGETDISNASRPISESEREACAAAGIEYVELPIANDGLALVANSANEFTGCLTMDELRRIWEPSSTVRTWADVRPEWPDQPIRLYGPGTNSGTFDYFTEEVTGEVGASRSDYTASEDDNVLVQGVSGDVNALGYFGFAYYAENQQRLKLIGVDSGNGCVAPTPGTIESGEYSPLSRPLMIYVNRASLARPAVREFVEFYLQVVPELAPQVGYVALSDAAYAESEARLMEATGAL